MKTDLRHLRAYLHAMEYSFEKKPVVHIPQPVITLSRQRGAQGSLIAHKTAEFLNRKSLDKRPWIVLDRSLAQLVADDHHLSQQISDFLTDEQKASIRDRVEQLVGLQPSRWTVVEKMTQTIMRLAEMGRVIFVGRAANIVTAHLPQVCHVRIVGSMDRRVQRVAESMKLSPKEAHALVCKADADRADFVSRYFHVDVSDPTLYDLTINSDGVSVGKAALLIVQLLPKPDDLPKEVHPTGHASL
jgi:cytidylate kinase